MRRYDKEAKGKAIRTVKNENCKAMRRMPRAAITNRTKIAIRATRPISSCPLNSARITSAMLRKM
jgi:hypothetical protein